MIAFYIILHLLQGTWGNDLEMLLKTQIDSARCSSKCFDQQTSEEYSMCIEICQLKQENPDTDICRFPRFFVGGCKTACGELSEPLLEKSSFNGFSVSQCSLNWKMKTTKNVVFVVAGFDEGGMWHFMQSSLAEGVKAENRFKQIRVLSVGESGVEDQLNVHLPPYFGNQCERMAEENMTAEDEVFSSVSFSLLLPLSYAVLGVALLVLIFPIDLSQ